MSLTVRGPPVDFLSKHGLRASQVFREVERVPKIESNIGVARPRVGRRLQMQRRVLVLLLLYEERPDVVVNLIERESLRELLKRLESLVGLSDHVERRSRVEPRFIIASSPPVQLLEQIERIFVLAGFIMQMSQLEHRRGVHGLRLIGGLFDGALEKSDARIVVDSDRPLDVILKGAYWNLGRLADYLIAREWKRGIALIQDVVGQLALKFLQFEQRGAAAELAARQPAFNNVHGSGADRYRAFAPLA